MKNVLDILDAHHTFMSNLNESDIDTLRFSIDADTADLAIRTCTCGKRINGFDEYHDHIRNEIERAIE